MDEPKFVSVQLEKLKSLFSKFVDITNDINVSIFIAIFGFFILTHFFCFQIMQHDANPSGHKGVMDTSQVSHIWGYWTYIEPYIIFRFVISRRCSRIYIQIKK